MAKINPIAVEFLKKEIEPVAISMKEDKYSQSAHHRAVAMWWIRESGVNKAKGLELLEKWTKVPKGFGANCSQFGQSAGRPEKENSLEVSLADFMNDMVK